MNYLIELITNKVLDKILKEDHTVHVNPETLDPKYVYHCATNAGYNEIFKFGFERYFVNRGAGNMYGPGVYTTTDLESSIVNAHKGTYGKVIVRAKVKSYDRYIIWDKIMAQKVYGNSYRIVDQLQMLVPEFVEEMKQTKPITTYGDNLYDLLRTPMDRTSILAYEFWQQCSRGRFKNTKLYSKINGFVFFGGNDGHVTVVKDVKNLIPYDYSLDYGRTWKVGQTEKTLKYTKDAFDSELYFGKKYDKVYPSEFGLARVMKGNKFNFIDERGNELSSIWFDGASDFSDLLSSNYPMAEIVYNNNSLLLAKDKSVYETPDDEYPVCDVDELEDYF